ncbi:DNA-binding response OmpR family regulator [Paenibacillus phyllosphaerae]|uniref:DNA-binding response OmpR family regulator n=1 Tax=Paenibacillus phyllosphaerae TaxID=274593 RepID=A0A7W5B1Z9_9BACL|nr:response regulator transcription factor [Paenibacillus phyllosphaerae]MBB3112970.1 DNA-binding response OmpR family regulator [Paenibacillus phyllosphaerae]
MKPIKLLTIDDDPHVCEIIRLYAELEGYEVVAAYDGLQGLELVYDETPDLIILDIMMPEMDGWAVCERIRKDFATPVIMLSGKGESYDKLKGFEIGVDDYVVKPFDSKELMARIRAVLRRTNPSLYHEDIVRMDELVFDMRHLQLTVRGENVGFAPKEIELLYYLASNRNRVFTRQQLLDQVWGFDYDRDPRTVDVHIKRIREKLRACEVSSSIETIRGIGYKYGEGGV